MIRLSACIEMLFSEIPEFTDRIPAAAEAGLAAFEFWGYSNKDLQAIAAAKQAAGIERNGSPGYGSAPRDAGCGAG